MEPVVIMYIAYALVSVALTAWVARTLFQNGRIFLVDVFDGNEELADAVNRLLVVGFYLLNLGYVTLALRTAEPVAESRSAIEVLSEKLGLVMLVLGGVHLLNVWVFNRMRRNRLALGSPPPVRPDEMLGASASCPPCGA